MTSERADDLNDSLPILLYKSGDVVRMLDRRCSWAPNGLSKSGMREVGSLPNEDFTDDVLKVVGTGGKYVWLDSKGMLKGTVSDDGEETPSVVGEDSSEELSWLFFGEVECDGSWEGNGSYALAVKEKILENIPDHRMVEKWIIDSGCGHDLIARILVLAFPS